MLKSRSRLGWLVRNVVLASGIAGVAVMLAAGCAGTTTETDGTANGPTTSTGGKGGMGGSATSTSGMGGNTSPCGTDCSLINTPQCQVAQCNIQTGQCEVVNDEAGVACDDGLFCTISDSCVGGSCVGGPQNDCGMAPPQCTEVTCDETSQTCSSAPSMPGAACQDPNDLCLKGSTCNNGLCIGGQQDDCFFFPVPDDCHVAVCNGTNGMCEPQIGNEGQICNDINDLCTVDKTCTAGVCQGGNPKDCSNLTLGCTLGVCDVNTGQCQGQAVMNGQACDDLDACTTGEICTSMTCGGGTPITACVNGDSCCPMNCNENNDLECAVDPDLVLYFDFEEGSGIVNDLAIQGNKTDGTLMGTTTRTSDAAIGNWAMHSPQGSGINDRLQIAGQVTDLDMTGPYTVMAWIKSANATGGQGIIVLGSCCTTREGYTFSLQSGGTQVRFWGGSTNDNTNYNSYQTGTFANNTWVHVGFRVNTTSLQWRVGGVTGTTSTISNLPTSPSLSDPNNTYGQFNPQVGGNGVSTAVGADVKIDEVRVYDKYLTDQEWTNAMNGL
jgi:hypothetical protein